MKAYELLFIVAPTIDDETRAGVMKRIETTITDAHFHTDPQSIAELDRVLRINDAVVRHMIVARTDRD